MAELADDAFRPIVLRGVSVHNLKSIDLDLPTRKLIVFCGVSGSGKSSLAFDTLYAEGQRRYIESFSPYTRQFLERLEKPQAERIDGIRPAIAIAQQAAGHSNRSTIGTATETLDYLRLLYAKIGQAFCPACGRPVRRETPENVANFLAQAVSGAATTAASGTHLVGEPAPAGAAAITAKALVAFPVEIAPDTAWSEVVEAWIQDGLVRAIVDDRIVTLSDHPAAPITSGNVYVIVDRLVISSTLAPRWLDSLELAFDRGGGQTSLFVEPVPGIFDALGVPFTIDGQAWRRLSFSRRLECEPCQRVFPDPEPSLFSFNHALGACPTCEGFGSVPDYDYELVAPDGQKSLRGGAIAVFATPSYASEQERLLRTARELGISIDVPFASLSDDDRRQLWEGSPPHDFEGIRGFFTRQEAFKQKVPVRAMLSRYKSARPCPQCQGKRLREEALAFRIGGKNIAELAELMIRDLTIFLAALVLAEHEQATVRGVLGQVVDRLHYLSAVGLDYLALDRALSTLSGGEAQRVALTKALGSSLVDTLYVLDEPSIGLHPKDTQRLLDVTRRLADRGNTVVVVEHEEAFLRAADHLVEIGPGAGEYGGKVVFQGTAAEMEASSKSTTGDFLSGRRGQSQLGARRTTNHGWIHLHQARGNNLQGVDVSFPLGVLCVVTGVSGAGKSTLVEETLYPALCRRMRKEGPKPLAYHDVLGDGQINDCVLVDQSPIGRSPRSNPVTYVKAFDEIRGVFSQTAEARVRNYGAGHFSFNAEEGRCGQCHGDGCLKIDMQFMPDVYITCPVCKGTRYRAEILAVLYRDRNVAEVLAMTVREAFGFFRGHGKVQTKLKTLIDVGLDYLRLGQAANTLSGGEAQRLKLASYLTAAKRTRTLFVLDEPTTGLHFSDITQLLDCFDALLAVGHSLIVVEHNMQVMVAADHIIDLGPGAAEEGGRIVAVGTPEEIAASPTSITGRYLSAALRRRGVLPVTSPSEGPPS